MIQNLKNHTIFVVLGIPYNLCGDRHTTKIVLFKIKSPGLRAFHISAEAVFKLSFELLLVEAWVI